LLHDPKKTTSASPNIGFSNSFVAATPVQDLRFRANDLRADAKLATRAKQF
jgi:hypothetical protein